MSADFLMRWSKAAETSFGLFWTAFWAFGLGYLVSSLIQVLVSRARMRRAMGQDGPRGVALGAFFGFISSSCSFAALSTTRALFAKGAGLAPALSFLLASTNLVIELGLVIAVFLGTAFVAAEYLGGVLLILIVWGLVRLTAPRDLVEAARARAKVDGAGEEEAADWRRLVTSREGWRRIAQTYVMEWGMVWKDVMIGFTVAGAIAVFVPARFFEALFVGSGSSDPSFAEVLLQCVVGPVAAFFTFIGSMGNIPLAAVLFSSGVSFAGVVAFIFSDLVVFPVLRIQAQYYGWRMALYILGLFFVALVAVSLVLHYGFAAVDLLPDPDTVGKVADRTFFSVDYTTVLNALFALLTASFLGWTWRARGVQPPSVSTLGDKIMLGVVATAGLWLGGGLLAGALARAGPAA